MWESESKSPKSRFALIPSKAATPSDPNVFSFERKVPSGGQGRNIIVALNMSDKAHTVKFDGVDAKSGAVLQSDFTAAGSRVDLGSVELPPFGATVIGVE